MKKFLALLLAVVMMLASTALADNLPAAQNPLVKDTDTVIISLASDLESLDPIVISTIVTNEVMSNAYEALVAYDLEGNVVPAIASDWTYDEETMTYTINLRDDVYFHDGSLLTADDVAFSLEMGRKTGRFTLSCNYIENVEVVSPTCLKVALKANYSPFLYFLAINLKIINKATYEANGNLAEVENGTGPYKMVEYVPGDKVVFEAFDKYFGEAPAIKNLIFKIIPDANTQYLALTNGEINLSRDFSMNNIQSIIDNNQLDVFSGANGNAYYLAMNQSNPALADVRVRQAINYAIDREFVIEVCEEGYAELANSVANKGMFGYTEDAKYYPHDPEMAKKLLADAGYADGLDLGAILTKTGKFKAAAEIIQEDLAAVGITVDIDVRDAAGFSDDYKKKNFTLCMTSVNLGQDAHHATMMFNSVTYLNYFNINDPELDAMCDAAAQEQDLEARKAMYHDILCKVADDALFAPIYYPTKMWAVTSGLTNATYDRFVGVLVKYMSWE